MNDNSGYPVTAREVLEEEIYEKEDEIQRLRKALDAYREALMKNYGETEELKALYDAAISDQQLGSIEEVEREIGQC